jgi:hypothetical protein
LRFQTLPNGYIFQTSKNPPPQAACVPSCSSASAIPCMHALISSIFLFFLLPHAGQSFPPFFFLQAFPSFLFLQAFPFFLLPHAGQSFPPSFFFLQAFPYFFLFFSFFRHICKLWPRTFLSFSSSSVLWALRNTQIEEISLKKKAMASFASFLFLQARTTRKSAATVCTLFLSLFGK